MKRVSVVGYGYAGRKFHTYLVKLADGLALDSIVEPDEKKRRLAEEERGVRTFASVEEMLNDGNADLVVVATPHNTHADLAIKAMEAGKHVVTDKAMCITAREADEMIKVSKKNGVMLSVFHNRRWDWDFNTVKDIIGRGLIGEPLVIESSVTHGRPAGWRTDRTVSGGFLYDWGSHLVDQALLLGGSDITKVYCQIRERDGIEEHAKLTLRFASGLAYHIEVGGGIGATIAKPRWFILGTSGSLMKYGVDPQEGPMNAGNIDAASEPPENKTKVVTGALGLTTEILVTSMKTSWKSFYQNISDVLNGVTEDLAVKPEGVRNVIAVVEAATRSAITGETEIPDIRA